MILKQIKKSFYKIIASEISTLGRYVDRLTYVRYDKVQPFLFDMISAPAKVQSTFADIPASKPESAEVFLFNGTFNYDVDIQEK